MDVNIIITYTLTPIEWLMVTSMITGFNVNVTMRSRIYTLTHLHSHTFDRQRWWGWENQVEGLSVWSQMQCQPTWGTERVRDKTSKDWEWRCLQQRLKTDLSVWLKNRTIASQRIISMLHKCWHQYSCERYVVCDTQLLAWKGGRAVSIALIPETAYHHHNINADTNVCTNTQYC